MMDLQGPEVRTSYLIDSSTKQRIDKLELKTGDIVSLYGTNNLSEVGRLMGRGVLGLPP